MNDYDLIIVGAGPAGLCLTRELSKSNFKILLLDKKKNAGDVQYNTAGSFINPEEWGLPKHILNPIRELYLCSKNEMAIKKGVGYTINRRKLLSFLERESKENKNLRIEYKSAIKEINFDEGGINYLVYSKDKTNKRASAKIFVDCSGVSAILGIKLGIVSSKVDIGMGIEYLVPLKKELHSIDVFIGSNFKGGYGWIFPIKSRTAIIGYGTLFKECFSDIEKCLKKMWQIKRVSERCNLKVLEKNVAILRTDEPPNKFTHKNLLMIGDSALQANPLLGEGIRFVMDASRIASKWIKLAIKNNDLNILKNYEKEWRKKYYKKYKMALLLRERIKKLSTDDNKTDVLVRMLNNISDEDLGKLLRGNLSYSLLTKIGIKFVSKKKFF